MRHPSDNMRHVFISTCGFYTAEKLYDGVTAHFRTLFRGKFCGGIACAQGGLFLNPKCARFTAPRLEQIKALGADFAESWTIPDEAAAELAKPLIPIDVYMKAANSQPACKYFLDHSKDRAPAGSGRGRRELLHYAPYTFKVTEPGTPRNVASRLPFY